MYPMQHHAAAPARLRGIAARNPRARSSAGTPATHATNGEAPLLCFASAPAYASLPATRGRVTSHGPQRDADRTVGTPPTLQRRPLHHAPRGVRTASPPTIGRATVENTCR